MSKNVAVFVDVANIFYAAKAAGVDIDYVTLLKVASAGRDLVRAYAYTGLDPDNENQRNFHEFLRRHGYKVVSKDIRKYGDGKVKANLDIELVVDMMKTSRNLDVAIVVSGDGDFAPAIRAVQEMGVRVEVISFRGNTSSDLIEVADIFTEITQVAKVDKGSSRSGRRVAGDEEDLSMTEVPDKQSEGTGTGRGRGRGGRGRPRAGEGEPAVAARGRGRARERAPEAAVAAITASGAPLVVLPGERLSKVAPVVPEMAADQAGEELDEEMLDVEELGAAEPGQVEAEANGGEGRRRRRRRGGRGRGRGRGRDEATTEGLPVGGDADVEGELEPEDLPEPPKRASFAFGSVWDSQMGIPQSAPGSVGAIPEDEDLDEPPIPEYLIAERRQREGRGGGDRNRGGAGRGRSAYAAAIDRERYGGGRSGGPSRYAEPVGRGGGRGPAPSRPVRPAPRPQRQGSDEEPWSEVPPELEAMLRAQISGRGTRPETRPAQDRPERAAAPSTEGSSAPAAVAPTRAPRGRGRSAAPAEGAQAAEVATPASEASVAAKPVRRRASAAKAAPVEAAEVTLPSAVPTDAIPARRRPTRGPARTAEAGEPAAPAPASDASSAPKRRPAARKTAAAAAPDDLAGSGPEAPKRRATRKKADAEG